MGRGTRWQIIVAAMVYVALILAVASVFIEPSENYAAYLATRPLDRNRRLLLDDIGSPVSGPGAWGWFLPDRGALEGKFVTEHIPKGSPIELAKLRPSPDLTIDSTHRPVIFPLDRQPQLSEYLNANSYVDVVGADANPIAPKVRVHAIVCPKPRPGEQASPSCYAILAVPIAEELAVTGKMASLRLLPTQPPGQPKGEIQMAQPAWHLIVENKKIPDPNNAQWTPILDYAKPGKLLRIEVVVDQSGKPPITGRWQPKGFPEAGCTADGDWNQTPPEEANSKALLLDSAPRGALIGQIGGSTADKRIAASDNPNAAGKPIVFAVGRYCVFKVPTTPEGALFLGVNDAPESMGSVTNSLYVNVYVAQ